MQSLLISNRILTKLQRHLLVYTIYSVLNTLTQVIYFSFSKVQVCSFLNPFAYHKGRLASIVAFLSFGKIEFFRPASGLAEFARVVTSDFEGVWANCGYYQTHHQKCRKQFCLGKNLIIIHIIFFFLLKLAQN